MRLIVVIFNLSVLMLLIVRTAILLERTQKVVVNQKLSKVHQGVLVEVP